MIFNGYTSLYLKNQTKTQILDQPTDSSIWMNRTWRDVGPETSQSHSKPLKVSFAKRHCVVFIKENTQKENRPPRNHFWWEEEDLKKFKEEAIEEVRSYILLNNLSGPNAVKIAKKALFGICERPPAENFLL